MSSSNKTFPNQIKLESGFKITGNYPIDDRLVVDDINSLEGLSKDRESYEGMIVTVKGDGTYQYLNNKWYKLLTDNNFDIATGEKYLTSDNYRTRAKNILNDDDYDHKTGNVILTKDNYANEDRAPEILTKNDILILEGGDAEFNPTTITTE